MPQYSVSVVTKDGKSLGTPWFNTAPQARSYMKRKLKNLSIYGLASAQVKSITMHTWRRGDTLKTVKTKKIKRL